MGDWNPVGVTRYFDDDQTVSPWSVTLTGGASANTKGAYGQFAASLSADCIGVIFSWIPATAAAYYLADLAIGAGGSEQIIMGNILFSSASQSTVDAHSMFIPLALAGGTRVAMRIQTSGGANTAVVKLTFVAGSFVGQYRPPNQYEDWGADTTQSFGTNVVSGNAAKGAYSQLKATTGVSTQWVFVEIESVTAGAGTQFTFDLATGAGGSEQVVIPNFIVDQNPLGAFYGPLPLQIPQGTRIAARAASPGGGGNNLKIHAHGGS